MTADLNALADRCRYAAMPDQHGYEHGPANLLRECETALRLAASQQPPASAEHVVTLTYTNYRGEAGIRRIIPKSIRYGSTEWHPEPQWLVLAFDAGKNADREFALKDFGSPAPGAEQMREACAKVAEKRFQPCDLGGELAVDFYTADTIAANIRALPLPPAPGANR